MPMTMTQIEREAVKLDLKQRSLLVDRLASTLPADEGIAQAWLEEAERRHQTLASGQVKAKPAKSVLRGIRKRLSSGK